MNREHRVGYTAGVFDLFHIGHLNLLRNARARCDRLIVGVSTDELVIEAKGKTPVVPFTERVAIVESMLFVDDVRGQDDLDKVAIWQELRYDVLFVGDDWKGTDRWRSYEARLAEFGAVVEYLPYTKTTSSTRLQRTLRSILGGKAS